MKDEIFEIRGVPPHHRQYWEKYIRNRTLADDVRTLLTTYRRIFSLGAMNVKQMENMFKELMPLGFTQDEITLRKRDFLARRLEQVLIRATPSIYACTYLYSFSPKAKDIMMSWLKSLLDGAPIEEDTKRRLTEFWDEVIENRPVRYYVNLVIHELVQCYAEGVINDAELMRELQDLKKYGISDKVIALTVKRAQLRRKRYAMRSGYYR